jgi:hypothetical protein
LNIDQFAVTRHARVRKDECGEPIINGKLWKHQPKPGRMYGHHIYEHGDGRFGVMLVFDSARKWNNAKKTLTASGFRIKQNAETEGTALFDPENKAQARLAMKITGARVRRQLSPQNREALVARLQVARSMALHFGRLSSVPRPETIASITKACYFHKL